jgi:hypothetical protein
MGRHHRVIKEATLSVGRAIQLELKSDSALRAFVGGVKYVYVDRQGRLVGTDMPRLFGIGRMRLSTQKIWNDKY